MPFSSFRPQIQELKDNMNTLIICSLNNQTLEHTLFAAFRIKIKSFKRATTLNQVFLQYCSCCRKRRFLKYPIEFGPSAPGPFADTMVFRAPELGKTFTVHLKGTGF